MINNKNYSEAMELVNSEIRSWASGTQSAMRNNIRAMSTKGKGSCCA